MKMDSLASFISSNPTVSTALAFALGAAFSSTLIALNSSGKGTNSAGRSEVSKSVADQLNELKLELQDTKNVCATLMGKIVEVDEKNCEALSHTLNKLEIIDELSMDIKREIIFLKKSNDIRSRRNSVLSEADPSFAHPGSAQNSKTRRASLTLETSVDGTRNLYINSKDRPIDTSSEDREIVSQSEIENKLLDASPKVITPSNARPGLSLSINGTGSGEQTTPRW